jgi:hypothetical protein
MSKPPGHILAAVMPGDPAASVKSIYLNWHSPTTCLIWRKKTSSSAKKADRTACSARSDKIEQ